ncbi:hypothetical protein B0H10DRAFT_2218813 [Mycena sp. CBHHK59/15]|nr:hypothetical protein B0H10DRAFT_2218813 [Mycena sp. CBHHK59/15]
MASKSSLTAPSMSAPQEIQLRSGWDDMLDVKKNRRGLLPNRKSVVSSDSSGYSPSPSPSPSSSHGPTTPEDDAFTSSTLTYLASPVAQALGLPSPVASPIASYASPLKTPRDKAPGLAPPRQPIPEDTVSTISSIWEAPWPLPPVVTSFPLLRHQSRSQSPSSTDDGHVYPLYSPAEPPSAPPFEGSSVPGRGTSPTPNVARRATLKKALRRTWSREALARGYASTDVIYMTRTVEETGS